jgi:hypothetical protein
MRMLTLSRRARHGRDALEHDPQSVANNYRQEIRPGFHQYADGKWSDNGMAWSRAALCALPGVAEASMTHVLVLSLNCKTPNRSCFS